MNETSSKSSSLSPVVQKATAYDPQWAAKSLKDTRVTFNDAEMKRYLDLGKRAHERESRSRLELR